MQTRAVLAVVVIGTIRERYVAHASIFFNVFRHLFLGFENIGCFQVRAHERHDNIRATRGLTFPRPSGHAVCGEIAGN